MSVITKFLGHTESYRPISTSDASPDFISSMHHLIIYLEDTFQTHKPRKLCLFFLIPVHMSKWFDSDLTPNLYLALQG